ncbi:hypothetical protein FLJU110815_04830 [Flavobacterium jumunjinense]
MLKLKNNSKLRQALSLELNKRLTILLMQLYIKFKNTLACMIELTAVGYIKFVYKIKTLNTSDIQNITKTIVNILNAIKLLQEIGFIHF